MEPNLPHDWQDPDWIHDIFSHRPHNWRNHVPESVKEIWLGFTDEQKQVLSLHFEELANEEEWD